MSGTNGQEPVLTERRGRLLIITLNRPEVRNAMNMAAADGVSRALDELEDDDGLSVGIITGAGGFFSTGMDMKAFLTGDVPYVAKRGIFGILNGPPSKPLIGAVEGGALAGGFELLLACDLVVAAIGSVFGIPEVKRGLMAAAGGLMALPDRIPRAVAVELALTGDSIDARRAHQLGLVNRLCEPGAAVEEAAELGQRIAQNAPLAVIASKRVLSEASQWKADERWALQGEIVGPVLDSEDAREGARAFAEKRPPVWRAR